MTDTDTAVANVENSSRKLSPTAEIRGSLDAMGDQLKRALPSHVSVEKFQRVAMTAIQSDPDLLYADRQSLFGAITKAAQDGLLPDKREGALVIFNSKVKRDGKDVWIKAVQWMPMIAGVLKKVRQSGEIASISANVVYANDSFVWRQGDDEMIDHQPAPLGTTRGEPIGVYAIAILKDGSRYREVMDVDEIAKVRSVSRSGEKGPWKDWWSEMARKTAIRRLAKRLPMSTDLESVINDETTTADFAKGAAALMASPQRLSSQMLAEQAGVMIEQTSAEYLDDEIPDFDGQTGEVIKDADSDVAATQEGAAPQEPDPRQARLDKTRGDIAAAKNRRGLKAVDAEWSKHRAVYDDDVAKAIDAEITAKMKSLPEEQNR